MKHLNSKGVVLGLGMVLLSAPSGWATNTTPASPAGDSKGNFTISLGTEKMAGDTSYRIGYPAVSPSGIRFDGYFPFSELEWPLDIWLLRVDGKATFNEQWRANVSIKKDLSTPDDKMIDSDWLTPSNPALLDVYSEFDISSFDALIIDADVQWIFLQRQVASFYLGAGFVYQNFDYESKLIYQFSPSGLPGFAFVGDGRIGIIYEVTYLLPYLKIGSDLQFGPNFTIQSSFSYSPIAQAEDTDHHLLRELGGKVATGDLDGTAYMIEITGRYLFTPALFLEAGLHYLRIEVDGEQYQEYGLGLPIGTVHQEVESAQTTAYLSVGFRF